MFNAAVINLMGDVRMIASDKTCPQEWALKHLDIFQLTQCSRNERALYSQIQHSHNDFLHRPFHIKFILHKNKICVFKSMGSSYTIRWRVDVVTARNFSLLNTIFKAFLLIEQKISQKIHEQYVLTPLITLWWHGDWPLLSSEV